ncbi:hypothetical protein C8E03_101736 [Lachnotalea glycerini]|jgi:hypothetical protein|uniref:GOLD domain-containing protein n=1 Tax=Lachnotalea glycerini TaxID=1763509 RepID=A0A255I7R1_9FIRM|nr:hypothetical protein [Lachnotalea glycerini]PXV96103.1 hypothetical protein C8E03_101736 [Lachnotalea glycerini]RDY29067.1 hypothetical protein CG710_018855 [Lachnotalea glycerini]
MKKNTLITALLIASTITFMPMHSYASSTAFNPGSGSAQELYQLNSKDTSIYWRIPSKTAYTKYVSCKAGQTLGVGVTLADSSAKARIGVIDPDGTYHTKSIEGFGFFQYEISSSGTYEIYCKNNDSYDFDVVVNYSLN